MIESITVKEFAGVPYLETSALMQKHKGALKFSKKKPNVLVGPNGTGKSALLKTLALRFLADTTGESVLDDQFIYGQGSDAYWSQTDRWGYDYQYLEGIDCKTDNAPVLYYRPSHVPGNEPDITHAMMCGYFKEARAYAELVKNKSSGQQAQAILQKIQALLQEPQPALQYKMYNWRHGAEPVDVSTRRGPGFGPSSYDRKAEVLRSLTLGKTPTVPLVIMDEPEQSLDALAEVTLWRQIRDVQSEKVQLIVASHSLYPLLNAKHFNLIETVPGYIKAVQDITA